MGPQQYTGRIPAVRGDEGAGVERAGGLVDIWLCPPSSLLTKSSVDLWVMLVQPLILVHRAVRYGSDTHDGADTRVMRGTALPRQADSPSSTPRRPMQDDHATTRTVRSVLTPLDTQLDELST